MDKFPRSLIVRLAPTLTSQITPAKKKERPLLVLKDMNKDTAVVLFKWMIAHCKGEDRLPKVAEPTLPNYIKLADTAEDAVWQLSLQHLMTISTSDSMQRLSSVPSKPRRCSKFAVLATGLGQCWRINSLL